MTRDKKILIGCVVAFVLLGLCACCGLGLMGTSFIGAAVGPAMEGTQVGQRTTNHEDCIAASFARADGCVTMDTSCGFDVGAFEGACLASVLADPTAFCQGVHATTAEAFCAERGRSGAGCPVVFGGKLQFCDDHVPSQP